MKHIAVVEDEKLVADELSLMLEKEGYRVTVVTDFSHVTEKVLQACPDLLLLDLNLPQESGFTICREIKNKSAIPVLVLTSRDQLRDEIQALELGADEFLTKPYRKERLLLRITNVLKRYEGRANLLEGPGFLLDKGTYTLFYDGTSVLLPKNQGKILETLPLEEYKKFTPLADEDVYDAISLENCVSRRISAGGTSPESVEKQLEFLGDYV